MMIAVISVIDGGNNGLCMLGPSSMLIHTLIWTGLEQLLGINSHKRPMNGGLDRPCEKHHEHEKRIDRREKLCVYEDLFLAL